MLVCDVCADSCHDQRLRYLSMATAKGDESVSFFGGLGFWSRDRPKTAQGTEELGSFQNKASGVDIASPGCLIWRLQRDTNVSWLGPVYPPPVSQGRQSGYSGSLRGHWAIVFSSLKVGARHMIKGECCRPIGVMCCGVVHCGVI